ncbi:MAG: hypothetical protein JNM57_05935 [Cyclobacteriaceae bacterium]|nr:hypothetical protein [Cyclobacteriaceae bacterium]
MENAVASFGLWDRIMILGCYVSIGLAVLIFLYHEYKILQIKDYKEKYDYVNLNEIKYFWYVVVMLILAALFYTNTIASDVIETRMMWFYVRLFVTLSFSVIAYFVFFSMVRIYYPRNVEKRLQKLRNTPRISPNGNVMRKLSGEEEATHLDAAQLSENPTDVHSIDYDIWIDDKTGYKKIEKYNAYQHAIECSECGFVTMKLDVEEIEKKPSQQETGLLLQHYQCSYCKHREAKEVVIAMLSENS